ncbi:hypothetical protein G6F64_014118 [Rhizopus arrhizus]|uniref:Uncharacterized protein n=1 Tax=Rhizopus oryzae TaxID=64495 RepID=A0A9P7BK41_RHIOR|nr:hypothetical protein G6F64_014118 [Rhizopus arrhizus]
MARRCEPDAARAASKHLVQSLRQQSLVAMNWLAHSQRVVQRDRPRFTMSHKLTKGRRIQTGCENGMAWLRAKVEPRARDVHKRAAYIASTVGVMPAIAL